MSSLAVHQHPPLALEVARQRHIGPLGIVAIYGILALAWIGLSDLVLDLILSDATLISQLQTVKGVGFVLVTAALLFVLVRRDARILSAAAAELEAADAEVEELAAFPQFNPDPVLVLAPGGEVRYRNEAADKAAETANLPVSQLLPVEASELIDECLQGSTAMRLGVAEAGGRHYDWTFFPHTPSGQVYAFAKDRTEELQLAARVIQGERFESLGRLAAGVSHDFNNVLVAIGGFANLLEDCVGNDEKAERLVGQLHLAAAHGAEMVDQLRRFGQPSVVTQVIDVNDEIYRSERLLKQTTGASMRIVLDLCKEPLPIQLAPGVLMQVLMNLVQNAADASAPGSAIRLSTMHPAAGHASIVVTDTGEGMSEEVRRKAFTPFFTTKHPNRGTGLGLMSVESVVRNAGGSVKLQSTPETGTTVTVDLPLAS